MAIHPSQIDVIRTAYTPTAKQLGWAERVLAAATRERGVFTLDGQMVDGPVLRHAEEIVRRSVEAWERGATEVCLQGGIHPDFDGDAEVLQPAERFEQLLDFADDVGRVADDQQAAVNGDRAGAADRLPAAAGDSDRRHHRREKIGAIGNRPPHAVGVLRIDIVRHRDRDLAALPSISVNVASNGGDSVAMTPMIHPAAAGTQPKREVGRLVVTVIGREDMPLSCEMRGWLPDRLPAGPAAAAGSIRRGRRAGRP